MNKAIIFDLDGTIYFENSLAPFVRETLTYLEENNYEIIFFTNNSTKSRNNILEKLVNLGIKTNISRVYTSSFATAKYLSENSINKVYLIGSDDFCNELNSFNVSIVSEQECEAVVVGLDTSLNYEKITKALIAINNGAKLIASNVDPNFPIKDGLLKPGANAIVQAIIGCSGKKVDYIVGKPNTYLLESIVNDFNLDKDNIWVVGDGIESDIAMANNYGCKSFLVHTNNKFLKDFINKLKGER